MAERFLGISTGTLLAAGDYRTTTAMTMPGPTNELHQGVRLFFDITDFAVGSTPAISFRVEGQDPVSLNWATLLSTVVCNATGTSMFYVHPHAAAVAGEAAAHFLAKTWRVVPLQATDTCDSNLSCSMGFELL